MPTEKQLNFPIEDLSVLPDTTAIKPASAKLRTITAGTTQSSPSYPHPMGQARHCPQPLAVPNSVLGSSMTSSSAWISKRQRTPWAFIPYHRPRDSPLPNQFWLSHISDCAFPLLELCPALPYSLAPTLAVVWGKHSSASPRGWAQRLMQTHKLPVFLATEPLFSSYAVFSKLAYSRHPLI